MIMFKLWCDQVSYIFFFFFFFFISEMCEEYINIYKLYKYALRWSLLLTYRLTSMQLFFADSIEASLGSLAGTKLHSIQIGFRQTETISALIAQTGKQLYLVKAWPKPWRV